MDSKECPTTPEQQRNRKLSIDYNQLNTSNEMFNISPIHKILNITTPNSNDSSFMIFSSAKFNTSYNDSVCNEECSTPSSNTGIHDETNNKSLSPSSNDDGFFPHYSETYENFNLDSPLTSNRFLSYNGEETPRKEKDNDTTGLPTIKELGRQLFPEESKLKEYLPLLALFFIILLALTAFVIASSILPFILL